MTDKKAHNQQLPLQFYVLKTLCLISGEGKPADPQSLVSIIREGPFSTEERLDEKVPEILDWMSRHGYAYVASSPHSPADSGDGAGTCNTYYTPSPFGRVECKIITGLTSPAVQKNGQPVTDPQVLAARQRYLTYSLDRLAPPPA